MVHTPSDAELFQYATDTRSDVRKIGQEALLKRLSTSKDMREALVRQVADGPLRATLLYRALQQKTPFDGAEVLNILELLASAEARTRWAALNVLDTAYLPTDRIEAEAARMTNDPDLEVREAAFRILDKTPT